MAFDTIPSQEILEQTAEALRTNGFEVSIVDNGEQAKEKALSIIPEGASVQDNTSITLSTINVADTIENSGKYHSIKKEIYSLDKEKDAEKMRILRSTPEYVIGSIHAVTHNGQVMAASNTGSNLPSYSYGAGHVILIVGAQKIVKDMDEGFKRIYEHSLPLETVRAREAYGLPDDWNSSVSKVLIINKEVNKGRIHIILVKEVLGF